MGSSSTRIGNGRSLKVVWFEDKDKDHDLWEKEKKYKNIYKKEKKGYSKKKTLLRLTLMCQFRLLELIDAKFPRTAPETSPDVLAL